MSSVIVWPNGTGSIVSAPNGLSSFSARGRKTRGCSASARRSANPISGSNGALTPRTQARLTTKTMTPEIADSPASTRIEASTAGVSVTPAERRSASVRAAGVQTAPGMYFASMRDHLRLQCDAIRNADVPRFEDAHPAEDEDEVVGGDRREARGRGSRAVRARAAGLPSTTGRAPPRRRMRPFR